MNAVIIGISHDRDVCRMIHDPISHTALEKPFRCLSMRFTLRFLVIQSRSLETSCAGSFDVLREGRVIVY